MDFHLSQRSVSQRKSRKKRYNKMFSAKTPEREGKNNEISQEKVMKSLGVLHEIRFSNFTFNKVVRIIKSTFF